MGISVQDVRGLAIESHHEDHMWIFTFTDYSTEMVDSWAEQVRAYREIRPQSNARYLVYDASAIKGLTFDAYLRQRSTELAEEDHEASGRVAIVVNVMPGVRHIFQLFVWVVGRRIQPNLGVHIFDKREAAIAWVEQACLAQQVS